MPVPEVRVAVLTYRRPEALANAMRTILPCLEEVSGAELFVIDNDAEPTAKSVVHHIAEVDPRVRYFHEPEPGIAAARNRAIDEAGDGNLVVFIDDDEQPAPGWLAALVGTWQRYQAAAVVGPVISRFDGEIDQWIAVGGFFTRRRHLTGTLVTTAATNNLLLDLDQVNRLPLRFEAEFGLSGGSDTVFTRRLSRSGARIVWCDEALVYDVVPPDRATKTWVRARATRLGNSDTRAELFLATPVNRPAVRLVSTARGAARVAFGWARWRFGRLSRSLVHEARGYRTMARGIGMLRGAWGSFLHEYARS